MTSDLWNVGKDPILVAYAGLLGALIGSFLNVCILRWGAEPKQSIIRPPSRCPHCGHGIRWFENIPMVSWLALRGRCRGCRASISVQYPLIELATTLLWAFMAWRYGFGLEALRGAVFGTLLLGIAVTDARAFIIPHEFSLGGTALAIAFSALSWPDAAGLREALLGACFGAGLVLLIGEASDLLAGQEAMGGGDCALMGMVGAFAGWEAVIPVVGLGAAISVVLYVVGSLRARPPTPGAGSGADAPSLRWGMMLKLLVAGGLLILGMLVAMRSGVFGAVLRAVFEGIVAAGLIYYASFLAPAGIQGRWPRVAGLLAAAVGIAVAGGLSSPRLIAGAALALVSVWLARRITVVESPSTTEELSGQGYLPFGVGLSLAAGLLALTNAYPAIRAAVAQYLQAAGLS